MTNSNLSTTAPTTATIEITLTPEQQARAEALYRRLLEYRRSGVRMVQVTLPRHLDDEPLRVAPIGRRVEIP